MAALAIKAADTVGAVYAGVDLIQSQAGEWLVLEVNSMPAWSGLQSVTKFDISQRLAGDLGAALSAGSGSLEIVRSFANP
jgi:glutathione synthase/RimK-type ligase-like ATP-grasp enzyme